MDILVVTSRELAAFAGGNERARQLVREGIYRRVVRNAYVLGDEPDSPELRVAALRRVIPEHAILSHWTALWVLGLNVLPRDRQKVDLIDLTTRRGLRLAQRPGVRTHSALVSDEDLCEVNGLLVVSAARAFVDVARCDGVVEGVACGDAALRAGATTVERIEDALERAGGLRWVSRAREALVHLDPRSESLMESRLRIDFVLAGGPRMAAQVDLYDEDGVHRGRPDLYLRGVAIEYDGRAERLDRERFGSDRVRANHLADLEVEVRRYSADLYYKTSPAERLATLLRALAIAEGRTRPRLRFGPDTLRAPRLRPVATVAEGLRVAA
jgi:hypothetical protein